LTKRLIPVLALLAVALALYLFAPEWLPLGTRIAALAIFVMSLDLVVGYAGLASLGHAAFWGLGGYASAMLATRGFQDPLFGLAAGGACGALGAFASGLILLRFTGLTFLVLTIAFAQVLSSLASKLRQWTGGDDGLSGFINSPVLGVLTFDIEGKSAFIYVVTVLLVSFLIMRRIVESPFGLQLLGIHQNRLRIEALGVSIRGGLMRVYVIAGFFAGIAGALLVQVNQVVGLDSFGFPLSAEALVMLVLGGTGTLIGAIGGTAVFTVIHHTASSMDPYHWLFVIGSLLVTSALVPRSTLSRWLSMARRKSAACTA
jgi:branched-chain amino acid transport system permease protein